MDLLINVDVPDLARAIAFYTRALGLTVGRRFGSDGVELLGANAQIYLLVKAAGSQPAPGAAPRDYQRHWTPVHLDLAVTDLGTALQRALDAGATLEQPVQQRSWGRMANLADPFGHGFCILQFSAEGYDAIAD
ncbi:MAG TPA: VOC family protein [Myxococcales bacterium]|nr:VOC family protein [Myxococcales bacterium]